MSKYSEDLSKQVKDIKTLREATKDVIKQGGKLALEEYHDAGSVARIKKILKKY